MADLHEDGLRLALYEDFGATEEHFQLLTVGDVLEILIYVERPELDSLHFCLDFTSLLFRVLVQVPLNLIFVLLLLRVVDGELAHEEITWVLVLRADSTHIEVVVALFGGALVHHVAVSEQDQTIAVAERCRARLMNRAHNSLVVFPCQLL